MKYLAMAVTSVVGLGIAALVGYLANTEIPYPEGFWFGTIMGGAIGVITGLSVIIINMEMS